MTIDSKCPKKWLFVDCETGDVWSFIPDRGTNFWDEGKKSTKRLESVVKIRKVRETL